MDSGGLSAFISRGGGHTWVCRKRECPHDLHQVPCICLPHCSQLQCTCGDLPPAPLRCGSWCVILAFVVSHMFICQGTWLHAMGLHLAAGVTAVVCQPSRSRLEHGGPCRAVAVCCSAVCGTDSSPHWGLAACCACCHVRADSIVYAAGRRVPACTVFEALADCELQVKPGINKSPYQCPCMGSCCLLPNQPALSRLPGTRHSFSWLFPHHSQLSLGAMPSSHV
jgi:hypothetical protein